jgi:hypothetical protein
MTEDPKPHPVPVDAASVAKDPLAPVSYVPAKGDVLVVVPRPLGQYGLLEAGNVQVVHDIASHPDVLEGEGVIGIDPEFVEKFLRSVEGSRLLKAPQLSAVDEALQSYRPRGRGELPPMSDAERADAVSAQARADAQAASEAAESGEEPAPKPKAKAPAKR